MSKRTLFLMTALLSCLWISTAVDGEEPTYPDEKYDTKHTRNVLDFW